MGRLESHRSMGAVHQYLCAWLAFAALSSAGGRAADTPPPLTRAADVLSLPAERAGERLRISVTGVVTAAEPDWNGQFFVQDATGGVFVENLHSPAPQPGDVVQVDGVSHPGAFAPIISEPEWRKTGTAALPEPKAVSIDDLMAGVEDSQRVEVSGVVRTARIELSRLLLDLAVGGYRLQVHARVPLDLAPESLVGAHVRVRGTAATHYNAALRHLTAVAVYAPREEDFAVLAPEKIDPFKQGVTSINAVAQYRYGSGSEQRVHVRGTVTLQRLGEMVFVQDSSAGIRIETTQADVFALGDVVEGAGFVEYENHLPVLRDAVLRRVEARNQPIAPRVVPFVEIQRGQHHGDMVTLRGRILDRNTRPVARAISGFAGLQTTWLVQGDDITFTVEHEDARENTHLAGVPIGSVVEVEGVCSSTVDTSGRLQALQLLLPSPASMRVVKRPSWFTTERLVAGVGLLSVVLLVVVAWSLTVSKKNAALKDLIREIEQAQRELKEAHDTLEQKVIERSTQLQVEMTARKTAEVQFKAVLAERTRLARDLHDTLEQTLTGIALRLETAARLAPRDAAASASHLQFARNLLHQSQVEMRRSIWDLRSRELEQFNLASALRRSAEQLVDGTGMKLEFHTAGELHRLPEIVEENVLRIGQEALTNIAKHAHASRVAIALEITSRSLVLRVEDDGVGFTHRPIPPPGDGHFGLVGMAERARRIAGNLVVTSTPERGTSIALEVPLSAAQGATGDVAITPAVPTTAPGA